jgi:hypothetical protein
LEDGKTQEETENCSDLGNAQIRETAGKAKAAGVREKIGMEGNAGIRETVVIREK